MARTAILRFPLRRGHAATTLSSIAASGESMSERDPPNSLTSRGEAAGSNPTSGAILPRKKLRCGILAGGILSGHLTTSICSRIFLSGYDSSHVRGEGVATEVGAPWAAAQIAFTQIQSRPRGSYACSCQRRASGSEKPANSMWRMRRWDWASERPEAWRRSGRISKASPAATEQRKAGTNERWTLI